MLRFYRLSPFSFIVALLLIAGLLTFSLPFILVLVVSSVLLRLASGRRRKANLAAPPEVSELIRNSQIGAYRIKQDESDPSVIEVISATHLK